MKGKERIQARLDAKKDASRDLESTNHEGADDDS